MNVMQQPPPADARLKTEEGPTGRPRDYVREADRASGAIARGAGWKFGLVAVLALAAVGVWWTLREQAAPIAPVASATASLPAGQFRLTDVEIRSLRIEPVLLREFRAERAAEGRIAYNEDRATPVFSPYSGRVLRAVARLGEEVDPTETLFEIETTDLVQAANDLLTAVDNVAKARTTMELARRNETRQRDLFAARAASRRDLEQSQADAANAAADLRVAETALAAARDRMRVLGRSVEQIERIEVTRRVEAVVAVRAPISGTVVQRRVGPGQWLTTGQSEPVYTIADLSSMWLVAAVRELDAPLIRVGQEVTVAVNALPDRSFRARVTHVGAALDATTRRLSVRAEIDDPERLLRPEMFASFRIAIGAGTQHVGVPIGAVIYRGAETSVWVALDDNRFVLRRIRTSTRAGDILEVVEGLAPGERVVTGGALFVDRAARID